MTRNLKKLILALLAAGALSAVGASAAQAAHFIAPGAPVGSTTEVDATQDGTGKTAHQVLTIENAAGTIQRSLTCNEFHATGKGLQTGETIEDVTLNTPSYTGNCQFIGQTVTINDTGCEFIYHGTGTLDIEKEAGQECKHGGKNIHFATANCKIEWGEQTGLGGITYHNINPGPHGKKSVTVETNITGITYNATGTDCAFGTTSNGKFTTGNEIWEGTRPSGTYVDIEWTA